MKKNQIQELKNKPREELAKFVKEGREKLRSLKFDLAAGKVKDIGELRSLRKDLARALTFMRQGENAVNNNK